MQMMKDAEVVLLFRSQRSSAAVEVLNMKTYSILICNLNTKLTIFASHESEIYLRK